MKNWFFHVAMLVSVMVLISFSKLLNVCVVSAGIDKPGSNSTWQNSPECEDFAKRLN